MNAFSKKKVRAGFAPPDRIPWPEGIRRMANRIVACGPIPPVAFGAVEVANELRPSWREDV